jgi:hypothetical protein
MADHKSVSKGGARPALAVAIGEAVACFPKELSALIASFNTLPNWKGSTVAAVAGVEPKQGMGDGPALKAARHFPRSVVFDGARNRLLFNDYYRGTVAELRFAGSGPDTGTVRLLATMERGPCPPLTLSFKYAGGFAVDPRDSSIVITDMNNGRVYRMAMATRTVSVVCGHPTASEVAGLTDGVGAAARFNSLHNVMMADETGAFIVADKNNNRLRLCTPPSAANANAAAAAAGGPLSADRKSSAASVSTADIGAVGADGTEGFAVSTLFSNTAAAAGGARAVAVSGATGPSWPQLKAPQVLCRDPRFPSVVWVTSQQLAIHRFDWRSGRLWTVHWYDLLDDNDDDDDDDGDGDGDGDASNHKGKGRKAKAKAKAKRKGKGKDKDKEKETGDGKDKGKDGGGPTGNAAGKGTGPVAAEKPQKGKGKGKGKNRPTTGGGQLYGLAVEPVSGRLIVCTGVGVFAVRLPSRFQHGDGHDSGNSATDGDGDGDGSDADADASDRDSGDGAASAIELDCVRGRGSGHELREIALDTTSVTDGLSLFVAAPSKQQILRITVPFC